MKTVLYELPALQGKILAGERLLLAGDEELLRQLPKGNWIAGTIPYFIGEAGGVCTRDKIHVTELPDFLSAVTIQAYDEATIGRIYTDGPPHGFSFVIIPAFSGTHTQFALNAPTFQGFATRPLIGWIAGVHLDDLGKVTPKVFIGPTGQALDNGVAVLHATLPADKVAEIQILNIFQPSDGDIITVSEDGFSVGDAFINGERRNLADYLLEKRLDTKLPLVADYYGAMVNVSIQAIDSNQRTVQFYAPLFAGIEYRHAAPIHDYVQEFTAGLPQDHGQISFSCDCILNYLYSELEGKNTGVVTGPVTFGEVAYQLLNQTMVYLTFSDILRKNGSFS
jgi:hypothetical protein